MSTLRAWLDHHGLGQHADRLAEHEIDFEVLPELEEADLEKIGLGLGSRKKLMKAIRGLAAAAPTDSQRPAPTGDAEHRQLTIMFADLVGSTELSRHVDPEELREINRAYQGAATAAIERFGGYVARYMGDGILAYFGYPRAHEDDAERALRAGLALVEEIPALAVGTPLAVRVGVATGPVVVGDLIGAGAAQESAVVGETPNLAARLQGIAEPNTVVLADATRRLVGARVDVESLGRRELKGMGEAVAAFRAVAVSGVGRFEASTGQRLTPLVGRDEELGILMRRWRQALDGEGQAVLLGAEAGVGKSRIVRALQDGVANTPLNRVLYYCSPYHRSSAFHPVVEQLGRAFRIAPESTPPEKLSAIESGLGVPGLARAEVVPVVAELLGVPFAHEYPALDLHPEELRHRTLDVLVDAVVAMAAREPVLFVVEDVHWVDPSTKDLLTHLLGRIRTSRVLAVITHRPEFEPPWADYPHVTALSLNNLGRRDSASMMADLLRGKALPESMIEEVIERTDGVPLFLEEITAALVDRGLSPASEEAGVGSGAMPVVPSTLQDLLMERLDRTGPAKEVAQLASVIGRSFTFDLLGAVSGRDEAALRRDLASLGDSGLVHGHAGAARGYDFKHALVRDVAYQSLLRSTRQEFHGRVAEALTRSAGDSPSLELIAHHFEEGDRPHEAARYWRRAGERALGRFAHVEANALFERALAATRALPEEETWMRFELETQTMLGPSLMYVCGQGAPEVERTYARALELGGRLADRQASFTAAWGMWRLQFARGDMISAHESARNCERVCAGADDRVSDLGASFARGATCLFRGDSAEAVPLLERSIDLYRALEDKSTLAAFGQDPGLSSLGYLAWARWALGMPDRAVAPFEEAVRLARDIGKPVLIAVATGFAGMACALRGDTARLAEYAEECLSICEQHQFRQWAAMSNIMVAHSESMRGHHARATALARAGLDEKVALHSYIALPWMCHLAAETHLAAGRAQDAFDIAGRGIAFSARGSERFCESENHRVQALVLAADPDATREAVETRFHDALRLAAGQPSFELRVATSFARDLLEHGAADRARALLEPIHATFTEGLDTRDLREAASVLAALG